VRGSLYGHLYDVLSRVAVIQSHSEDAKSPGSPPSSLPLLSLSLSLSLSTVFVARRSRLIILQSEVDALRVLN